MPPSGPIADDSDWVDVASIRDFGDPDAKEFFLGQSIVAVFHVDDRWYALDGMCAHQGGPVAKGQISCDSGGVWCVTCPWHGWQYELETGIQTANRQPLQPTFPVRIRGGRVELRLPPAGGET